MKVSIGLICEEIRKKAEEPGVFEKGDLFLPLAKNELEEVEWDYHDAGNSRPISETRAALILAATAIVHLLAETDWKQ